MQQTMTVKTLAHQNRAFAGTKGIRRENHRLGFKPGFLDRQTGSIYPSCNTDGNPAPVHVLDGLPDNLVSSRTASGQIAAVKGCVVPGFILDDQFYTCAQVARILE